MRLGAQLGGLPLLPLQPRGGEETYISKTTTHTTAQEDQNRLSSPPNLLRGFLDRHAFTDVPARDLTTAGGNLGVGVWEGQHTGV